MDNVVQNININDIIPSNFEPTKEEKRKIEELAILIKQFGLLEPILVRTKNEKYEIILGVDKYQAALLANQTIVPVIIKEVDDEIYSKYSNIDTNNKKAINIIKKETKSNKEKNSDIVNLSELSKIKLEYERDDLKMNNGQFTNDMNNNFNQPNQGPTFGGRFFPSLEDEPTNMNMMGEFNTPPSAPVPPTNDNNNNLIDLTDLSIEKELPPMMPNNYGTPGMNVPNMNLNQPQTTTFETPNLNTNPMPLNDNIINIDSLQNNNPAVTPISSEPVSMEILNADFGAPQPQANQFNMNQTMGFNNQQIPAFNDQFTNFNLNQPQPMMMEQQPRMMPNFEEPLETAMQPNFSASAPTPTFEQQAPEVKDVTPVTNTIKNLVASLAEFGYKINLHEEESFNTAKITIEIEK